MNHGSTAMTLKFHDIFARRTRRAVKPEHERFIEQLCSLRILELTHSRGPRLR
jgi:hypothetical protein